MAMKLWELLTPSAIQVGEALDQPAEWSWRRREAHSWEARFEIEGVVYWVYLDGKDTRDLVTLTFMGNDTEDLTGTGNSFQVLATVIDIVRDFMAHRKPEAIYFSAKEPSRRVLYARLAKMAASELGGRLSRIKDGGAEGFQINLESQIDNSKLTELFDRPSPWEWTLRDSRDSVAEFDVPGEHYDVSFTQRESIVEVLFNGDLGRTGISNNGQQNKVFSTVVDIIRSYVESHKNAVLLFSAFEASRKRLYSRMVKVLTSGSNLQFKIIDDPREIKYILGYDLENFDINGGLNEDGKIVPGVNTTCDVGVGETSRQAAKFGNALDAQGRPPLLSGSYGDDSARFSANQGDPKYGADGTKIRGGRR